MNSIKRNYFYNTVLQFLLLVVPLITTPYLTRRIGAEGIGTYAYYYSVASYFMLFIKLGLDGYGNREIAEHRDNAEHLSRSFSELFFMQAFLGALVSAAYIVYALCFSSNREYVVLFFIQIFATCVDINWFLYGMEEFRTIAIRNAIIKLASTILIFLLIHNSADTLIYCLILLLCNLISNLIAWPIAIKKIRLIRVEWKDIRKHIRPNLWLFFSLLTVYIYKAMDKVMLGMITGGTLEVGYYEAAERIVHIPNILVVSLGTVMVPRVSNMIASNDDSYKKMIMPGILFSMIISSSMVFGIMAVSKEFVPIYYGAGFESLVSLYLIMLPCCLFMAFANVIRSQFLAPNHKDKEMFFSGLFGAGVNVIVNLLMIPHFGAAGAAFGTLLAEAAVCIVQVYHASKELSIRKYLKYSIRFILLGIVMFACVFFPTLSFCRSIIMQMAIKILAGIIIFGAGAFIILQTLKRDKDEDVVYAMEELKSTMGRITHRTTK